MNKEAIYLKLNVGKTLDYIEKEIYELSTVGKILAEETIKMINEDHSVTNLFVVRKDEHNYHGYYPTMLDNILSKLEKANIYITPEELLKKGCFVGDDMEDETIINLKIKSMHGEPCVGDEIEIISMKDEPQYTGKTGIVEHIDDAKQIHGTWGGCALIPGTDEFKIVRKAD